MHGDLLDVFHPPVRVVVSQPGIDMLEDFLVFDDEALARVNESRQDVNVFLHVTPIAAATSTGDVREAPQGQRVA